MARALAGAAELDAAEREAHDAIEAAGDAPTADADTDGPEPPMPVGPPTLVLENSAGSGWGLGVDIDELAGIAAAVADAGVDRDRLAFCLDTAHAWGAGFDLADPAAADAFLAEFDARIGLDRLAMLHLNDSRSERGSRLDRLPVALPMGDRRRPGDRRAEPAADADPHHPADPHGLAVAFAFRAGLFNIGGKGQYIVGAIAAVWVGSSFAGMPGFLHIVLAIVAACAAGAVLGRHRRAC